MGSGGRGKPENDSYDNENDFIQQMFTEPEPWPRFVLGQGTTWLTQTDQVPTLWREREAERGR